MRYIITLLFIALTACGSWQKRKEEVIDYTSIVGDIGDIYVKMGDSSHVFRNYKVVYSNSDAATLLIEKVSDSIVYPVGEAPPSKVYIQGPAVFIIKE